MRRPERLEEIRSRGGRFFVYFAVSRRIIFYLVAVWRRHIGSRRVFRVCRLLYTSAVRHRVSSLSLLYLNGGVLRLGSYTPSFDRTPIHLSGRRRGEFRHNVLVDTLRVLFLGGIVS